MSGDDLISINSSVQEFRVHVFVPYPRHAPAPRLRHALGLGSGEFGRARDARHTPWSRRSDDVNIKKPKENKTPNQTNKTILREGRAMQGEWLSTDIDIHFGIDIEIGIDIDI